jgi:hypothetical protein
MDDELPDPYTKDINTRKVAAVFEDCQGEGSNVFNPSDSPTKRKA